MAFTWRHQPAIMWRRRRRREEEMGGDGRRWEEDQDV